MEPAVLDEMPGGKEFEELISACLQTKDNFVQRSIEEHKQQPLLELDIIVTDYSGEEPNDTIVEVKSGNWGAKDLFKVKGWMFYTGVPSGMVLVCKERPHIGAYKSVAERLGVGFGIVTNMSDVPDVISSQFNVCNNDEVDIACWRFSYWLERNMLSFLQRQKKQHPDCKRFSALLKYYDEVTNGIFFAPTPAIRLWHLYNSFERCPRITSKCAHEMAGEHFDREYHKMPEQLFNETFYDAKLNELAVSCFIEYRSRLSVLKSAVDFLMGLRHVAGSDWPPKYESLEKNHPELRELPPLFVNGLYELSEHEYLNRYPVFWQWFTWLFGGFVLPDYEDQEYSLFSQKTGIPVKAIPDALKSYELLFPHDGGWFIRSEPWDSYINQMHMFPLPFRGVGALYRVHRYVGEVAYDKLKLTGNYTRKDLVKWHNAGYRTLKDQWDQDDDRTRGEKD